MAYTLPSAAPRTRRPVDVLGIVAVCVAGIVLLPALAIFLIGLIPEMNALWWLGIVFIPLLAITGAVVVVLGGVGIGVAVRRRGRWVLSVVAVVLGVLMLMPLTLLWLSSLAVG
ncbi:hypothetical protein ACTU3I_07385 [Microbacterium sp. RD1]|uniref:hypothetical protein n=1 Tax=Microbacterium sp. RD1 TaxID=3457313 RepID=UPI003FA5F51F